MPPTSRQLQLLNDIQREIQLYLTRVIALPDLSARLQEAIEELELDDKMLMRALLDCWTTLELIASTDSERSSLREIEETLQRLRELVREAAAGDHTV